MLHDYAQKLGMPAKSATYLFCILCCADDQLLNSLEGLDKYTFWRFSQRPHWKLCFAKGPGLPENHQATARSPRGRRKRETIRKHYLLETKFQNKEETTAQTWDDLRQPGFTWRQKRIGFAQFYNLPFMISKQFTHPDFCHSLGKDESRGTLSTKDKAPNNLVKVNLPSQHLAAIFVSQFHSLSFLSVKMYHKLKHTWDGTENAERQSFPLPWKEPCVQDDAGAGAWGRVLASLTHAVDTYTAGRGRGSGKNR